MKESRVLSERNEKVVIFHVEGPKTEKAREPTKCRKVRYEESGGLEHYKQSSSYPDYLLGTYTMVHGCMVYTERAETAPDSCGTSHASAVSTPLRWIFKNAI